jgi:hypothetical protein
MAADEAMSELRVPTVALAAEVLCADGRSFLGRIFVPAAAYRHSGPIRAEEWMNEAPLFFPFLPDDAKAPVILCKAQVLVMSVRSEADQGDLPAEVQRLEKRVLVECGGRVLEGLLEIDMPVHKCRVLDYVNRPQAFITLRDGDRHHLVHKAHITRVVEAHEED